MPVSRSADDAIPDDAQLMERVAKGSQAALAAIYDRHGTSVQRVAQHLRCSDAVDEVVHDVFVRLWERPSIFDPARGSLRSFLLRRTHGRSAELMRRDSARRTGTIAADPQSRHPLVDGAALAHLAGEHAWILLAGLSDQERSAVVLAYFGGHTYREIASLLEQPEDTINSWMRDGFSRLRSPLSAADAGPPAAALPTEPGGGYGR